MVHSTVSSHKHIVFFYSSATSCKIPQQAICSHYCQKHAHIFPYVFLLLLWFDFYTYFHRFRQVVSIASFAVLLLGSQLCTTELLYVS